MKLVHEDESQQAPWSRSAWPRRIRDVLAELGSDPQHETERPVFQLDARPDQPLNDILRTAAEHAGWVVSAPRGAVADLAVALTSPTDLHAFAGQSRPIAVVLTDEASWARSGALDAAKVVLCPSETVRARVDAVWGSGLAAVEPAINRDGGMLLRALVEHAKNEAPRPRIGVATCARRWDEATQWGDTHLARGLMRAFRRQGYDCTELVKSDWGSARAARCDVVVQLRGLARRPVSRDQLNVLWIISHPERVTPEECDDYDIIASASPTHAKRLASELGREVHFLPQATDADTFTLHHRNPARSGDVVYVGNARWPRRRGPRWLIRNGQAFRLYGRNWTDMPEAELVVDEHVPNRDLADLYGSAALVVADHHGSMRTNGFVSNRIFDVLASGGVVVSDTVDGLTELFGDTVRTYQDPEDLKLLMLKILADPAFRRQASRDGRTVVHAAHTLDHRASELVDLILNHDRPQEAIRGDR